MKSICKCHITFPRYYPVLIMVYVIPLIICGSAIAAQWNPETTNWGSNPNPVVGDWGFNRPGYPSGLYIHGVTVANGQIVTNPTIYDNDIVDDVLDDEWAFVMTDLGLMNLVGYICTPVLNDGWGFSHPEWKQEFYNMINRATNSGMCMDVIPPVTIGTEAGSESAGVCKWSEGAQLYVDLINQQYNDDPTKPLIVNIGGQGATLASAWCIDNSIGGKCVVYYTDLTGYNGAYSWAGDLIAQNFRVVNFGREFVWWGDTDCQNQWNVLPRPDGCGCPTNDYNSGEWGQINNGTSFMTFYLDQLRTKCWYYPTSCGGCLGHGGGQCSDGYFDGTFIHAWAPGMFPAAGLEGRRGGTILYVKQLSESPAKAVTFNALKDQSAFDGQCPSSLEAPEITSINAPSSDTVNIAWQDNSSDPQEDGFVIERKPYMNADIWEEVGSVNQNQTTFTDTNNLHGSVEYTYRVGAYKN